MQSITCHSQVIPGKKQPLNNSAAQRRNPERTCSQSANNRQLHDCCKQTYAGPTSFSNTCWQSANNGSLQAKAYARPTSFSDTSHSFTAFPSSATSSDTWFSKAPVLLFQLQYTPDLFMLGSDTTYRQRQAGRQIHTQMSASASAQHAGRRRECQKYIGFLSSFSTWQLQRAAPTLAPAAAARC